MEDADERRKRLKTMRAEADAGGVAVEAAPSAGAITALLAQTPARWLAIYAACSDTCTCCSRAQAHRGCQTRWQTAADQEELAQRPPGRTLRFTGAGRPLFPRPSCRS